MHHPARLQHQQPVGQHHRLQRVVRDQDDRAGEVGEVGPEEGAYVDPGTSVERGHRLVEQEHLRLQRQGTSQRHSLGLASRELVRATGGQLLEAEPVQPLLGMSP